jgi:hypothetical protein
MVTLTEVEDEHFQAGQVGPDVDDDDYTDTGSSTLFIQLHIAQLRLTAIRRVRDLQRV